jgi:hypothetical protein
MKLPRVRFTMRRLMVAVVIVAVVLAIPIVVERSIRKAMNDFYGPGGYLDQRDKSAGKT